MISSFVTLFRIDRLYRHESWIFAPILVPALPIWLETIVPCWPFRNFTKFSICTAKSMESIRNVLSAIRLSPFRIVIYHRKRKNQGGLPPCKRSAVKKLHHPLDITYIHQNDWNWNRSKLSIKDVVVWIIYHIYGAKLNFYVWRKPC